jgi:hypothetical protein
MVYLRLCRAGIHTGLAGAQDYPAIYIHFYEGTEYPEIPVKWVGSFSKMGDDLVADGRNKNGTGSVHEIFSRK